MLVAEPAAPENEEYEIVLVIGRESEAPSGVSAYALIRGSTDLEQPAASFFFKIRCGWHETS